MSSRCIESIYHALLCCSISCLVLFHCRPLNGNGKIIILCALCALSEAGGEYKLTYLHSKAGTFSLAEGFMD